MPAEHATFVVEQISKTHDLKEIKRELDAIHGVTSVSVNPYTNRITVDYNSAGTSYDRIENRLNRLGYQITADSSVIHTQ